MDLCCLYFLDELIGTAGCDSTWNCFRQPEHDPSKLTQFGPTNLMTYLPDLYAILCQHILVELAAGIDPGLLQLSRLLILVDMYGSWFMTASENIWSIPLYLQLKETLALRSWLIASSLYRLHSAGHLLDISVRNVGLGHLEPGKGYHFPDGYTFNYIANFMLWIIDQWILCLCYLCVWLHQLLHFWTGRLSCLLAVV